MIIRRLSIAIAFCLLSNILQAQVPGNDSPGTSKARLPNGWTLSPAGRAIGLGDLPLNIAISRSGKYIAVTNNGVSDQSIELIDAKRVQLVDSVSISKSWLGLKFSADEKYLYASGGNDNRILKYAVSNGKLIIIDSIILGKKWPEKISPAGLEIDDDAKKLYVVTKESNSLYVIDLAKGKVEKQLKLGAEGYTCLLSPDGRNLYISLWGGDKVLVYNTRTAMLADSVNVGRNPNDLCLSKNGKFLFVANSLDNSVSVIDTKAVTVIESLNAALYPESLSGSTTNSVALSANGKSLYIANADNNCLAVFDVSKPGQSFSKGFIPVGWYPTCVRVANGNIYVANGKGFTSLPNPKGPRPVRDKDATNYKKADKRNEQYIGSLLRGSLSIINEPEEEQLGEYSKMVYENTPYHKKDELLAKGEKGNPIPMKVGDTSPIKHVFYIIKENRTYDQVLGDVTGGNGDTSLVLFGEKITPNEHAIAKQFVLLDNFYLDAEVSADGHNWSTAAYANDYVEKTWPTSYGGRGGTYDYSGNRKIALPEHGFLWDYAMRGKISFRNYGEFTDEVDINLPEFAAHTCKAYRGWDLNVKDVDREKVWEHDFDSLEMAGLVPQLNLIYFPNDHTSGLRKGAPTPYAQVADNDLALGKFLEHLSKSKVWNDAVVFVLEDDAQNGSDHVDAHRSTAFVAGPYVKRNYADHAMYSTASALRTIELILGLPPMSQYDAAAQTMWRSFSSNADTSGYAHLSSNINLEEKNLAYSSKQDELFDLSAPDRVPDLEMNKILWAKIKGENVPYPSPKRAAFVKLKAEDD